MLCGDEVRAAVVDLGSSSCRFGAAGQDMPRLIFKTDIGVKSCNTNNSSSSSMDASSSSSGFSKYVIGDVGLRYFDPNVDVFNALSGPGSSSGSDNSSFNGSIQWDAVESILRYGVESSMREDPSEIPLIMTESKFHSTKDKARLAEIIFESMSCPSWYMGANSMFSSFSTGHPTSLVIDLGGSGIQIVPVVDGFPLRKSTFISNKGGDVMDRMIKEDMLIRQQQSGLNLKCFYERPSTQTIQQNSEYSHSNSLSNSNSNADNSDNASSSMAVENNTETTATSTHRMIPAYVPVERASYRNYHLREIHRDIKQWMCFVPYNPLSSESRAEFFSTKIAIPPYVLPDGSQVTLSENLCSIPERLLFLNPNVPSKPWNSLVVRNQNIFGVPGFLQPLVHDPASLEEATLTALVHASISRADVDIRKDLLSKIVLTGGSALIDGVGQRLVYELGEMLATQFKIKLVGQLPAEKVNSAWIGASITSICGTFQQLWISSQEYNEHGGERIIADKLNHCLFS